MAVTFKFSTIDDSLGIDGTFLTGINNSGQIVGDFFDSNSFERGFLYGGGSYTTLVDPSAPFGTIASGINGTGQIVGYYSDFSGLHGFLYAAGNYTTLDGPVTTSTVSYPPLTEALGINDIGQVVGYYVTRDTPSTSSAHGYLYGGGNYITLDDPSAIFLGDGQGTFATGINGIGQVVGYYFDGTNDVHGFLHSGGQYITLDDPLATLGGGAGEGTVATGINNLGQIVGYYEVVSLDGIPTYHGFLYSNGTYITVDDPSGVSTFITGINDSSQIVGYYLDSSGLRHGFFANGAGVTPIVINNINDLQAIQDNPSGYYVLGANIDAAGFSFTPIGSAANPFTGIFDGQGHTISNLTINNVSDTDSGLFGDIGATGTVRNVGLINETVTSSHSYVGGLVGENFGTVSQSYMSGTVSGVNYVGALMGFNHSSGSITQSYATGTASGQLDIGGLVGINQGAISESYATGTTNPSGHAGVAIGGLVGVNSGSITQSYATGLVGAGGGFALGGLVGSGADNAVTASYWDTQTAGRSTSAGGTGLTTAQLESGILPAGFDPTIWFDIAGRFPELRWQVPTDQPPVIDTAHSTVIGTINEVPNGTGSLALDIASGAIAFTDADLSDRPTASVVHQTVTYQDTLGHFFQLADDQVFRFENAILLAPESGNTNNGKIDWTYALADSAFDFAGVGETITVASTVEIDDGHGGKIDQDVTVTINGSNDKPIAVPDFSTVLQGGTLTIDAKHGVLANDADPDIHDLLHVAKVNGSTLSVGHAIAGKYGTLTLNADGHYTYISNKAGPGGVDTFTYSIDDGHGGTASSSLSIFDQAAAQVVQHSQIEVAAKAVQSLIGSDTFWVNLDNAKQLYDAINTVYSLVKDDISFVQFENQLDALQAAGVDGQFIASWRSLTSDAEANIIMADSSKALPELWKVVMDKTVDIVIEHLVDDQLLSSSDRPFAESLGKTSVNLIAASALGPAALPGQLWDQSVLIAKEIVGLNLDLNGLVNDEIRNGLIDISYFDQSNTKTNPKLPALIDQQISSMTRIGDDLVNGATNLLDLDAGYKIDLVSFLLKARVDQLEGKQTSAVADVANAQSFAVSLDAAYGLHDNPFAGPLNNHFENFATLVADNYHIAGWHV